MKLYFSHASPYARKVRITALEVGLLDQTTLEVTDAWSATRGLPDDNPLCKVPTLLLDDGTALFDSPVICEYLDSLGKTGLFPAAGPERWKALRLQALADGMVRACDALEGWVDDLSGPVTIGSLAVLVALGYLDLRFAEDNWRAGRPKLAAWFETASKRPSFQATKPPA